MSTKDKMECTKCKHTEYEIDKGVPKCNKCDYVMIEKKG